MKGPGPAVETLTLRQSSTVLDALKALDATGLGIVFVVDEDARVFALATDGDIRRFLIRGGSLQHGILHSARTNFFSVPPTSDLTHVLQTMMERGYDAVPILDDGRLVGVHTLRGLMVRRRHGSWAVVMAGGLGSRLGEMTHAIPKPMLPVGGVPILERIVRQLTAHGFERIFLSVNYLSQMIEDHFGDGGRFHCQIEYLRERQPLGTGGALALLPARPPEPLLVMNGDLITGLSFSRLMAFHHSRQDAMTIALREHTVSIPYGVAETDGQTVRGLREKPSFSYRVNAGVYAISPDLLADLPGGAFPITALADRCLHQNRGVGAYFMDEEWIDVGLPSEYERAQARDS